MVGPTQPRWTPTGRVVADNGFRPVTDGFAFFNYSNSSADVPNIANHYLLGTTGPIHNLGPTQLRQVFGPAVCTNTDGGCELTLPAAQWQAATNAQMEYGHCWGMAVAAARLYNRAPAPGRLTGDPAAQPSTGQLDLDPTLQRFIAAAQATQDGVDLDSLAVTPAELVAKLRDQLAPGRAPVVIAVASARGEKHTLLPYALLERAPGEYDVAVYDSNFPGRARAMHVDVGAGRYRYQLFPGPAEVLATTGLAVVPVPALMGQLTCPFCLGSSAVTVRAAAESEEPIAVRITGPAGLSVLGAQPLAPAPAWHTRGGPRAWTVKLPAARALEVHLRAPGRPALASASVVTGDYGFALPSLAVQPAAPVTVAFDPVTGRLRSGSVGDRATLSDLVPGGGVQAELAWAPATPLDLGIATDATMWWRNSSRRPVVVTARITLQRTGARPETRAVVRTVAPAGRLEIRPVSAKSARVAVRVLAGP